jgi:hypothetical protein
MTAPFSGLEDRFLAQADAIYTQYSTRDRGDGSYNDQPFLEWTPDDPNALQVVNDTRFSPVGSVARDTSRIADFLASQEGIAFLNNETAVQTGNVFSETRQLNPNFITANVVPNIHAERSNNDASQIVVLDSTGTASPASEDPNIQMAGRLQQETVASVIAAVTAASTAAGLLGSLSPSNLMGAIAGAFTAAATVAGAVVGGPEGVNQRPELNINGQWFSILTWHGFQQQNNVSSNLQGAANDLANGNVVGAATQAIQGVSSLLSNPSSFSSLPNALSTVSNVLTGNRNSQINTDIAGSRYFITDPNNADRYLVDSMLFDYNSNNDAVPSPQTSQLDRQPYVLGPAPAAAPLFADVASSTLVQQALSNVISPFQSVLPSSGQGLLAGTALGNISLPDSSSFTTTSPTTDDNPGENSMLFSDLSLDQRYNTSSPDVGLAFIQQQLANQLQAGETYWQANQPTMGFVGGLTPTGAPVPIDPQIRTTVTRYFHDRLNELGVMTDDPNSNVISAATINNIQQNYGQDLINVFFYDYVNKKTIPFRAFIANIQENITPEIVDTRYIGRVDRNIVYVGVTRELSFGLYIHAMNDSEMSNVWSKINYMTGLCFPSQYQQGFMVPPLVRLTVGDFYRDQPGYIRSLSHQIEPNVPWETLLGKQVPHGVLMNCAFSVVERSQMQAGSEFYPFNDPTRPSS